MKARKHKVVQFDANNVGRTSARWVYKSNDDGEHPLSKANGAQQGGAPFLSMFDGQTFLISQRVVYVGGGDWCRRYWVHLLGLSEEAKR